VVELYRFAMEREWRDCAVVRAKLAGMDGDRGEKILGTVIVCKPDCELGVFLPALQQGGCLAAEQGDEDTDEQHQHQQQRQLIGGIIAPVVTPSTTAATAMSPMASATPQLATLVLQGLALMGLRQNKALKAQRCVLSWVQLDEGCEEALAAMGFEVMGVFEEFTNAVGDVKVG
jgi:beta-N-acetylhexosaminidase